MCHPISNHLKFRQKYSAMRRIFNSLLSDWKSDETLSLVFDILFTVNAELYYIVIYSTLISFTLLYSIKCILYVSLSYPSLPYPSLIHLLRLSQTRMRVVQSWLSLTKVSSTIIKRGPKETFKKNLSRFKFDESACA